MVTVKRLDVVTDREVELAWIKIYRELRPDAPEDWLQARGEEWRELCVRAIPLSERRLLVDLVNDGINVELLFTLLQNAIDKISPEE